MRYVEVIAFVMPVLFGAPLAAHAGDQVRGPFVSLPPEAAAASTENKRSWYGWQTLLADASSVGIPLLLYEAGGASGSARRNAWPVGMAIFALGAPMVHWGHGNGVAGLQSLGLRLALPGVFGLLGYAIGEASSNCDTRASFEICFAGPAGAVAFAFLGLLAAVVIDATVLSWKKADVQPKASLVVDLRSSMVGLGGRF